MNTFVLFIPQLKDILAIVNGASINMAEQLSMEQDVETLGHEPRSGITGSWDRFCLLAIVFEHDPR